VYYYSQSTTTNAKSEILHLLRAGSENSQHKTGTFSLSSRTGSN